MIERARREEGLGKGRKGTRKVRVVVQGRRQIATAHRDEKRKHPDDIQKGVERIEREEQCKSKSNTSKP